MLDRDRLRRLLDARKPGHTLPQPFYTDPDIFRFDVEAIYGRHWILIGFEVELAEPGRYLALTIAGSPIVVLRDKDGALRGFFNSCRHRGAQICADGSGTAKRLVCPYHQWVYGLDGKLLHAGKMPESFDKSSHGLKPIRVEAAAGAIYVCLSETAPDLEPLRTSLGRLLAAHDLRHVRVAAERTLVEKANWKLVMENARECYHCGVAHPGLSATFPINARAHFESAGNAHFEQFNARMAELGVATEAEEGGWWQAVRFPLKQGTVSMTFSGRPVVAKPLASIAGGDLGSVRWAVEPHSFCHALGDYVFMFSALPIAPQETLVVAKWLIHENAEPGVDYDSEELIALWNQTNLEDRVLVENNQRGVNSLGYEPGPYCEVAESLAMRFTDWYCRTARSHLEANA